MIKTVAWITTAACAFLMCASGAFAQNNNKKIDRTDELFLKALAPSNEADIQISRMAERSCNGSGLK